MRKIYQIFMVPEALALRLSISMQLINSNCQTWMQSLTPATFGLGKEQKLKLTLETRNLGDVIIVYCQGRLVYRQEAEELSRLVGEVLEQTSRLVLDLSGVRNIDGAGIGELVLLQILAQNKNVNLKCAGPNAAVRNLLNLTNLDAVIDVYPSVAAALESFREEPVYAD
jgi:anti-anti-sigma factor